MPETKTNNEVMVSALELAREVARREVEQAEEFCRRAKSERAFQKQREVKARRQGEHWSQQVSQRKETWEAAKLELAQIEELLGAEKEKP